MTDENKMQVFYDPEDALFGEKDKEDPDNDTYLQQLTEDAI